MQKLELLDIIGKPNLQELFDSGFKVVPGLPKLIFVGAAYMYTFHLDDFETVRKHNILGRYDVRANVEWHRCLERWVNDQSVTLGNRTFKPIKISRNFYRVTNEGMEAVALSIVGSGGDVEFGNRAFRYRSIGDGDVAGDVPNPSTKVLVNEIDRIDVNSTAEGGSLSRDGTTIYSIGNHSNTIPTPAGDGFTECGMEDTSDPATDLLLDYSIFEDAIPHTQNAYAPGSTTVIYQCSS